MENVDAATICHENEHFTAIRCENLSTLCVSMWDRMVLRWRNTRIVFPRTHFVAVDNLCKVNYLSTEDRLEYELLLVWNSKICVKNVDRLSELNRENVAKCSAMSRRFEWNYGFGELSQRKELNARTIWPCQRRKKRDVVLFYEPCEQLIVRWVCERIKYRIY